MSQQLIWSWLMRPWAGRLSGGRVLASWQRQLALRTAKLKAFNRAWTWIAQISEVATDLRYGPLVGYCLAELTDAHREADLNSSRFQTAPPQGTQPWQDRQQRKTARELTVSPPPRSLLNTSINLGDKQRKSRFKRQFFQTSPEKREQTSRFKVDSAAEGATPGQLISPELSEKLPEGRSPSPASQLPRQVNRDLLSRLASPTTGDRNWESLETPLPERAASRQIATLLGLVSPPSRRSPAKQSPGGSTLDSSSRQGNSYPLPAPNSGEVRDWWPTLARRVEQVLHQPLSQLSRENLPTSFPPPERTEVPSLANQGKLTLDGPAVAQEWLSHWARQPDFSRPVLPNHRSKSSELGTSNLPLQSPEAVPPSSPSQAREFGANNAKFAHGLSPSKEAGKSEAALVEPWLRNQPGGRLPSPSIPFSSRGTLPRPLNAPGSEPGFSPNLSQVPPMTDGNFSGLPDSGFSQPERVRAGVVPPNPWGVTTSGEGMAIAPSRETDHFRQEATVATALTISLAESDGMPSLLSLLAHREGNQSPPATSTAIRRRAPRQVEPPTPEDDLHQLADQIQRILDEEARRHGIDV